MSVEYAPASATIRILAAVNFPSLVAPSLYVTTMGWRLLER